MQEEGLKKAEVLHKQSGKDPRLQNPIVVVVTAVVQQAQRRLLNLASRKMHQNPSAR